MKVFVGLVGASLMACGITELMRAAELMPTPSITAGFVVIGLGLACCLISGLKA